MYNLVILIFNTTKKNIFIYCKLFKSILNYGNFFIYNIEKLINSKGFLKKFYNFILNVFIKLFPFVSNTFFNELTFFSTL